MRITTLALTIDYRMFYNIRIFRVGTANSYCLARQVDIAISRTDVNTLLKDYGVAVPGGVYALLNSQIVRGTVRVHRDYGCGTGNQRCNQECNHGYYSHRALHNSKAFNFTYPIL